MEENKNVEEPNKNQQETLSEKETSTGKMKKSGKHDTLFFGCAVVVILAISILLSEYNLVEEMNGFFRDIWNNGQEAVAEAERVKTVSEGAHIEIENTQVIHLREIYEILGKDIDETQAIAILQEVKTLSYYGQDIGVAALGSEVDACIEDIKKKLKEADETRYNKVVKRYGDDEDEYWTVLEAEVEEYVISEKMKEEKREEFSKKKGADVEKELQEYIDKIVGYENFK